MSDAPDRSFAIRSTGTSGGRHELTLSGRVYADAAPALRAELGRGEAMGARRLVVDASGLEQIDAVALRAFVDLLKRLPEHRGIAIFGLSPLLERTFALIGLDKVLHVVPTRAEALTRLGEP